MGVEISLFMWCESIYVHRLVILCMCEPYVGIVSLLILYMVVIAHLLTLFNTNVLKDPNVA